MTAALVGGAEKSAATKAASGGAGKAKVAQRESGSVRDARTKLTGSPAPARGRLAPEKSPKVPEKPESKKDSRAGSERKRKTRGDGAAGGRSRTRRSPGSQPKIGVLIAEWLLALVLISVTVPMSGSSKGYQQTITSIMLRLTGLTGIFFALALIGTSQKAARFTIWFGLLIDLGIIYHASTSGALKATTAIFQGQSISGSTGGAQLAADFKSTEPASQMGIPAGGLTVPGTTAQPPGGGGVA
jgi:hypothetical protein